MDIISDKIVVSRKPHWCFACARTFPAGTKLKLQVNTCDGIQSVYSCLTCNELMTSFKDVFFDDTVDMFNMYCVSDQLSKDQTPEDLLFNLKRVKQL